MLKRLGYLLIAVAFEWSGFAYPADVLNVLDNTAITISGGTINGATIGATTPSTGRFTTVNGNTFTTGTGVLTIAAAKTLTANNTLTLAGTDAQTMTFPATSATIARTDAANSFTGVQTFLGNVLFSTDNTLDIGATGATRPRDMFIARHIRPQAATVPTMGACGTSPSVTGSDHGATITVGTGGVATSCAMNFGVAFAAAPACVAQNNTDKVTYSTVTAVGSVTISATGAFTASSLFYVVCMGS